MKNNRQIPIFFLFFIILLPGSSCIAQEFKLHKNGLVYDESTMSKLHIIVDSLNLKFKQCTSDPVYQSLSQARIHSFHIKKDARKAVALIKTGLTFTELEKAFPKAETVRDQYLIHFQRKADDITEDLYRSIEANGQRNRQFETPPGAFSRPLKGEWIYEFNDGYLTAFYLLEDLSTQRLPQKYALMVGYADCMVDTTTQIFSEVAWDNTYDLGDGSPKVSSFIESKASSLRENMEAVNELDALSRTMIAEGGSNQELETLAEIYISKERALALKRSRIVSGFCSQDDRPRRHAWEIARLSAETTDWSIFLRSHLDLMNDNFHRRTDGNYAWGSRSTYIKELENLDIGTRDLLLGVTLQTDNPAENHYQGSNYRTARAIAESENPDAYLGSILEAIKDTELDLFNRMCMTYLILNYFQQSEENQTTQKESTRMAINTLPDFVSKELLTYLD
ncbi:MAG: hypothetical protein Roseis2KO_08790 [Roseivirga sp.]